MTSRSDGPRAMFLVPRPGGESSCIQPLAGAAAQAKCRAGHGAAPPLPGCAARYARKVTRGKRAGRRSLAWRHERICGLEEVAAVDSVADLWPVSGLVLQTPRLRRAPLRAACSVRASSYGVAFKELPVSRLVAHTRAGGSRGCIL